MGYTLLLPPLLNVHDSRAAEKWNMFRLAWTSYALATELNKKLDEVQVATLLAVIGEEAREVFSMFTDWVAEGDDTKIEPVLEERQYVNGSSPDCNNVCESISSACSCCNWLHETIAAGTRVGIYSIVLNSNTVD